MNSASGVPRDYSRVEIIRPDQFASWILAEAEDWIVLNKPPWVVCHPSKRGPWSSLAGAAREFLGLSKIHFAFRLDRETSGVILLAKTFRGARRFQRSPDVNRPTKRYLVILRGTLDCKTLVEQPIEPDEDSEVAVKQRVGSGPSAKEARTGFRPLSHGGGYTLAEVDLYTGRKHQIRVHAEWLGYPVAGDKLYSGDPTLYLEFARQGWTERHEKTLEHPRQALHAWKADYSHLETGLAWEAPLADDLVEFCNRQGITNQELRNSGIDRGRDWIE